VTLQVRIPAGVDASKPLRLRGQGNVGQRGGPSGDVLVHVEVPAHPFLRRVDRDLEMDVPLTLAECVEGAHVEVPVLTGAGRIKVRVPPGTQNGARLRIPGKGVQVAPPGDLYLVLRPQLPTLQTGDEAARTEAARLARSLDAAGGDRDVRASLTL
jgi:molecular chaperone DnaJ